MGKLKNEQPRDQKINLRLTVDELKFIDRLVNSRKKVKSKLWSRSDVIVLACKFALGELTILERMEMNLAEGKTIFEAGNIEYSKYTGNIKENHFPNYEPR